MNSAVLNRKIGKVEGKIPDTTDLVNTVVLNTKIGELKNKISGLFRKTVHDIKKNIYFTAFDYNKLTNVILYAKTEPKE